MITKATATRLEKVFEREIEGGVYQSKAGAYDELAQQGLVQKVTLHLGQDRFGAIEVTGWILTLKGNYEYCAWAAEQETT